MYPNVIPLTSNLEDIKIPIFAMAMGWHGKDSLPNSVYNYNFTEGTVKLLKRIESDGFALGCRDFYSKCVLRKAGIYNTIMTGCAAWYDLDFVGVNNIVNSGNVKTICISDPASMKYYGQFIDLIKRVRVLYPDAKIKVIFHRGLKSDDYTAGRVSRALDEICTQLNSLSITYDDISYGWEGFSAYNDCDIHIGYRVHAHIYNLSQRRRSILIEEDGRGAGVNDVLGLTHIRAYDPRKSLQGRNIQRAVNRFPVYDQTSKYICNEVEDYLINLESANYEQFIWAFQRMQYYYGQMRKHLECLK